MKNIAIGFIILLIIVISIYVILPYTSKFKGIRAFPRFFKAPEEAKFSNTQYRQGGAPPLGIQLKTGDSIYKGKVRISSAYTSGGLGSGRQQVVISASFAEGSLNVSGWRVVNSKGYQSIISGGVNLIGFSNPGPIYLNRFETLTIVAGPSPISDNFRNNKCLGWLALAYSFDYSPGACPQFTLSDFSGLDGPCKDLLLRTSSCREPRADELNQYSRACRDFVDRNYNYSACVIAHSNDSDFYYGNWRVYTGTNAFLFDPLHDELEIRDQGGFLVDTYRY